MIWISFGKWNHKAGSMFIWERVYRNGYKWTPFVIARIRYRAVGQPVQKFDCQDFILTTVLEAMSLNKDGFRDSIKS